MEDGIGPGGDVDMEPRQDEFVPGTMKDTVVAHVEGEESGEVPAAEGQPGLSPSPRALAGGNPEREAGNATSADGDPEKPPDFVPMDEEGTAGIPEQFGGNTEAATGRDDGTATCAPGEANGGACEETADGAPACSLLEGLGETEGGAYVGTAEGAPASSPAAGAEEQPVPSGSDSTGEPASNEAPSAASADAVEAPIEAPAWECRAGAQDSTLPQDGLDVSNWLTDKGRWFSDKMSAQRLLENKKTILQAQHRVYPHRGAAR